MSATSLLMSHDLPICINEKILNFYHFMFHRYFVPSSSMVRVYAAIMHERYMYSPGKFANLDRQMVVSEFLE